MHDVSLKINPGERIAVLGANGSGKSTLALVIAGLIKPTAGSVRFNDADVTSPTGALVFQSPDDNLLGETVRDELRFCLEQHVEWRDLNTATEEVIQKFNLQSLSDRRTNQLSGGERQVVAVACAMISRRPIIVLDEPTSHLDEQGRRLLWSFLDDARTDGSSPAIIVVTQYQQEVGHFERTLLLDSGSITYDGPPSGVRLGLARRFEAIQFPPRMSHEPILSVSKLSQVEFPGWNLPDEPVMDVTLDICPGEAIALCGPIGAGKTTLALLLAGLIEKFDGKRVMNAQPPVMLMQFPERQIFCNTVEEEVAHGLRASGISKADTLSRSHTAMLTVGLRPDEFGKRDPFSLSGGQKRRVMLAVAAAIDSPLYILDEPQAALDDVGVDALRNLCSAWLLHGSSYVLISHDYDFLRSLTSRVIVMNRGRTAFDGNWDVLDKSRILLSSMDFD